MSFSDPNIELEGAVWFRVGDEKMGGSARIALLAQIAEKGSITQAAKAVGMSYKGAWDAIDTMNNLAGEPLVERLTGGKGGGGTRLTERGAQLVRHFQQIERAHQAFLAQLQQDADRLSEDYVLLRSMAMKTSARNQFLGRISVIKEGAVNDEVALTLPTGQVITAIVTHESTQSLGLKVSVQAFALIKSSSIILMTDDQGVRTSARNRLTGQIERIQIGAVNSDVVIALGGGLTVAAVVTNESVNSLCLKEGQTASALFKASSVILGVPA